MKVRHLRVFCMVYEKTSVSAAARSLNVTQPPVTRMLKVFEDSLGIQLFVRENGRLVPTPEADRLYEEARGVFARIDRFEQTAEDLRTGRGQTLSISTALSLGHSLLVPALKRFRKRYPDIPVQISTGNIREQQIAIEQGDIDLCMTFNAPEQMGIKRTTLGKGNLVVIMPTEHPLAKNSAVSLQDLAEYEVLSMPKGSTLQTALESVYKKAGGKYSTRIMVESITMVPALISAGMGISIVDQFTSETFRRKDIIVKRFSEPVQFHIQALTKSDRLLSSPLQLLIDEARAEVEIADRRFDPG